MTAQLWASAGVALLFLLIHLASSKLLFLSLAPRSVWLSAAGGISVAYVFVHLLPELAAQQDIFEQAARRGGPVGFLESHVYLVALIGLAAFYALERFARSGRRARAEPGDLGFKAHVAAFGAYNVLIGYLLVHRENHDPRELAAYAVALGVHLLVNDHGLRQHHGPEYDGGARWLLAVSPVAGWLLGVAASVPPMALAALFAFLAGGVVLNVLKEELPEDRQSRFWAFFAGAALYSALLLAAT